MIDVFERWCCAGEGGAVESGLVLGGRYRLVKQLGRGGMGEVWRADDRDLGRQVAIKIVLSDLDGGSGLLARLRREATTAAALQHPGITVIHDIGDHDGHPFFVMELLLGKSFKALLDDNPDGLPVGRVVSLAIPVAEALAYAHHKGVIHRDIKPANLFELAEGGVKICDFGVSWYTEATSSLTPVGSTLGTPAYMAPEQYEGLPADARSDLYSLGCTLYAMLTGKPPFTGESIVALMRQHLTATPPPLTSRRPGIPTELENLVLELLAKDPADRPASGVSIAQQLHALTTSTHPAARKLHLWRRRVLLGGLGLVGMAALATVKLLPDTHPQRPATGSHAIDPIYLKGHRAAVVSVAFSPDGKTLASGSLDRTIRLWDVATGQPINTLLGPNSEVLSVVFSPDGKTLASSGEDRTVRLWDVGTGRSIATLKGHTKPIGSVAFSPDGRTLASGSDDHTVRLWDVATGHTTATLTGSNWEIFSVAFSPDGKTLASGDGFEETVRLWDVATARIKITLKIPGKGITSVAFSPDGKFVAGGGGNGTTVNGPVRLWDVATGHIIATFTDPERNIYSVAFSPDGKTLATGQEDQNGDQAVRVWNVAARRATASLRDHTKRVFDVTFSPDGKTLATAREDNMVRLWRI